MHRTTIILDENLEKKLRNRAVAERKTLTELIQHFLREALNKPEKKKNKKIKLPSYSMGKAKVDPADRSRLWDLMDEV